MTKALIWPVVVVIVVISSATVAGSLIGRSLEMARDKNDLRRDELIVQECAKAERPLSCAEQLREAMEVTPERLDSDG